MQEKINVLMKKIVINLQKITEGKITAPFGQGARRMN